MSLPIPTDSDKAPAHALWVELSTRITTQRLHYRSGNEESAASSIYGLFGKTRGLLDTHPKAAAFQALALELLNGLLRSNTARWHGWMTEDKEARNAQGKTVMKFRDEWFRRQFRAELRRLQPRLVGFQLAFAALKAGSSPEAWWTSDEPEDIAKLQKLCPKPASVHLGKDLEPGIQDQVPFAPGYVTAGTINASEQHEIRVRRGLPKEEDPMNATALAFSGGGIRSATYCLGITQVLARRGLLGKFDYLSTVSGGGYLGSFLSAQLGTGPSYLEDGQGDAKDREQLEKERALRLTETFEPGEDDAEPRAIRHLRNRSRYLMDDTVGAKALEIGMVLAGILFNLLIVLPIPLMMVLLTVGLYKSGLFGHYDWTTQWFPLWPSWGSIILLVLLGATFLALLVYPWAKGRGLKATRRIPPSQSFRRWTLIFKVVAVLTGLALLAWITPVSFRLYHFIVEGELATWLGVVKVRLDAILAGLGLTSAVGIGAWLASKAKKKGEDGKWLKYLVIASGPLLYFLVYYAVGDWLMFPFDLERTQLVAGIVVALLLWAWFFVDVNVYSPHGYYRDRLSSCYLGAPRPKRLGKDDHRRVRLRELNDTDTSIAAPYHLINTTVNLPTSDVRDIRGRQGDFFLFSKHYCGSPICGYHATESLEDADPHLDLGTAMAISGAAASSNMGWKSINSMRLLLTLANVRLGYWLRNPRLGQGKTKKMSGPGPFCLFREMFAKKMDEKQRYLNLSDGGHIENLAAYELLRRRCKFIVCVDGGMEPDMQCTDLIRMERYASIDLGIRMHYDLSDLMLQENGYSRAYGVLVKIDYDPPEDQVARQQRGPEEAEWGWMLYIKLAMIGYGPGYVMDYKQSEPKFPHETTGDQLFDEAQFEAYRALGEDAAESFFRDELIGSASPKDVKSWFHALAAALLPDNDEAVKREED